VTPAFTPFPTESDDGEIHDVGDHGDVDGDNSALGPDYDDHYYEDDFVMDEPPPKPSPTAAPTPPSMWKRPFVFLWTYTFWVPDRTRARLGSGRPRDDNSFTYDYERQTRMAELENEISGIWQELDHLEAIVKLEELDLVLLGLFGKEFRFGEFALRFLEEIRKDWDSLGNYEAIQGNVMTFRNGGYCGKTEEVIETDVTLKCSNESRLVNVVEAKPCRYQAVFVSPVFCREDAAAAFDNATLEELREDWEIEYINCLF
jgi:hypothetical protein